MKKAMVTAAGFLVLGIFFLGGRASAADAGLKALNVSGRVLVEREGKSLTLNEGDSIRAGDQLKTDGDSRLDVVKAGSWGFRLLQSGDCTIARAGETLGQVQLDQGNIIFNVKPGTGERFSVKTPVVVAAVRGTQFWGQVTPSGEKHNAVFAVREGKVDLTVTQSQQKILLEAGQAVEIKGETGTAQRRDAKATELEALEQAETIAL